MTEPWRISPAMRAAVIAAHDWELHHIGADLVIRTGPDRALPSSTFRHAYVNVSHWHRVRESRIRTTSEAAA